jgi:transposase-like protein
MTRETRTRRTYTEEFKREAVALVTEQGYRITQAEPPQVFRRLISVSQAAIA